jgi:type II secretory pathway pseudopilin PulG
MSAGKRFLAPLTSGEASGTRAGGYFSARKFNPQKGFTYIGLLIFVAIASAGLAAFGEIASHAARREKEAELLFRGSAIAAAIASYYKKESRYPASLEALLEDKRFPMPVRHLRKLYPDPMTGEANWALIEAPGGGVMGVHSRADAAPIKTGNFPLKYEGFADAQTYADWKFVHSPPGLGGALEKSPPKEEHRGRVDNGLHNDRALADTLLTARQ